MSEALVQALQQARRRRTRLAPLDAATRPADQAAGYRAQAELARARGAVPPAGFKVGATAMAMRQWLGLNEPMGGFMEAHALHPSGAVVPFDSMVAAGVECEIALRLGADLPARAEPWTKAEVTGAVAAWFPAIELVDNRYGATAVEMGAPTIIADQVFHAGAVLGADAAPGIDLPGLRGRITVDGVLRGEGAGSDLMGDPGEVLAWLASSGCAASFGGLRAGQVVLLGSVCPPVWLDGPCLVRAEFGAFGCVEVRLG